MDLSQFIAAFARRHWRAYAAAARDALRHRRADRVGAAARRAHHRRARRPARSPAPRCGASSRILLGDGRRHLPAARGLAPAAVQRGVPAGRRAAHAAVPRLSQQGPPFFHRQRTGDLMARATNDVDAVEMAAGEAFLAAFDGTLTLVLVVAMMTLGIDWRLGLVALLPFPFMALAFFVISRHVHEAWRQLARPLLRPQRARAGDRGRGAHAARAGARGACRAATSRSARQTAADASFDAQKLGVGVRARGRASR